MSTSQSKNGPSSAVIATVQSRVFAKIIWTLRPRSFKSDHNFNGYVPFSNFVDGVQIGINIPSIIYSDIDVEVVDVFVVISRPFHFQVGRV